MKLYSLVFIGPVALTAAAFGLGPWVWMPALLFFGVVPALDQVVPLDTVNPSEGPRLRFLPMLFVPAHLAALAYALSRATTPGVSLAEQLGLGFAMGVAAALAINVAHELMHRPGRVEQRLAEVLMTSVSYTHFCIEHVQGHHKHVATERDPATSRLGESLYQYLPRTLWGGLRSAWAIESARSGARNRMWAYAAAWLALVSVVGAAFGGLGVALFLGQSAVAVLLLETINYVEHYGLQRAEIAPGKPERVKPHHSWNSSHRLSNWMLLNLARHSDHHAFAARAFPELRHYDDVPQLPASYSAMVMLATVPPLWFRLMDPRVAALARGATPAA